MRKVRLDKRHMRDLCLLAGIFLLAGFLFVFFRAGNKTAGSIEIRVDGEVVGTYPLANDAVIPIDTDYGHNTLTIEGGTARMTEADCPDGYCMDMAPLDGSSDAQTIVCLPHHLVVEAAADDGVSENDGVDVVAE